jgi:hypothetical protein
MGRAADQNVSDSSEFTVTGSHRIEDDRQPLVRHGHGTRYSASFLRSIGYNDCCAKLPMTRPFQRCLVAATMLCCVGAANAQLRPVVIELFTSQGGSSCPRRHRVRTMYPEC